MLMQVCKRAVARVFKKKSCGASTGKVEGYLTIFFGCIIGWIMAAIFLLTIGILLRALLILQTIQQ